MQDLINAFASYFRSLFGPHIHGRKSAAYAPVYIHNAELHRLYRRDRYDR